MQLQAIAQKLKCELEGDPTLEIVGVASLQDAKSGDLSFVSERRYLALLSQTAASAVIVEPNLAVPAHVACLRTPHPRLGFAHAIELFYQPYQEPIGIHPTAVIDPSAELGAEVRIGAHVVIGAGVRIGDHTEIHANVTIYPGVRIGHNCQLFANCVIHERSQIGDHCLIHSGAVIGDDGFGHVPQADGTWYRMLQSGYVVLEEGVDIGSNTTLDRPAVGETRIGRGTKIDNLVQLGHGVKTGSNCVLVSQVGVSGGVELGHHVVLGGQVGVAGHIKLGDRVMAVGQTGITGDVGSDQVIGGYPHQAHTEWRRVSIAQRRLPELLKTIRHLERRVQELEELR